MEATKLKDALGDIGNQWVKLEEECALIRLQAIQTLKKFFVNPSSSWKSKRR